MHAPTTSIVTMDAREFKTFRELIHRETGIFLQDGKQVMLASRLAKRLRHHRLHDFAAYAALLEQDQGEGKELAEMINCITTNKTSFFREKHHFDFLSQTLVPDLAAGALLGRKRSLRIWSAACSSGEEPYSITISVSASAGHGLSIECAYVRPRRGLGVRSDCLRYRHTCAQQGRAGNL